ncbi:TetR/AcrR family transcriptional regulator [Streptomyces tirandamycinicus]|uniref:TetR/AcrR family transcriptional regulator n=1 Tax=Streptomyces tirandamycinicus TaxID=2174846 RepID=UPI001ABFDB8D|nr:TetR/AcrR family transcriptional regulator [Streptomyces tirandamycinicus]
MRTRQALVDAAAEEFDRYGYDGTSLSRISAVAGMSIGAVTFHFPSKVDLADAVQQEGRSVTLGALDLLTAEPAPPLRMVVDLTLELARLMEQEPSVRSAIRLSRERPGTDAWSTAWLPTVRRLLDRAYECGQLRTDALPADVTTLVEHLTNGAEAYLRSRTGSDPAFESAVAQLKRVWHLALVGVSAEGPDAPRMACAPPEGTRAR